MPLHSRSPRSENYRELTRCDFNCPDYVLKVLIKDVADEHTLTLKMKRWPTIKDIKDTLQKQLHVPQSSQLIYFGPLPTSDHAVPNQRTLADMGIYRFGEALLWKIKGEGGMTSAVTKLKSAVNNDLCISPSLLDVTSKNFRRTVQQARRGLSLGLKPDLVLEGSGGTYFLRDARKIPVAVFKPADEEPYAENNPRGYVDVCVVDDSQHNESKSMRQGIKPGEACLREVAAFLLDHGSFSGVPMTTLAEARHPAFNYNGSISNLNKVSPAKERSCSLFGSLSYDGYTNMKVGSVQEFVPNECSMDDLSPSKIGVDEVHKIAILDIRTMNADRNSANLLCRRNGRNSEKIELIPIDHGYCLRSVADICWFDWCWLDWPQLKQPLSKRTRNYILKLDIEADVKMLQERLHIPKKAIEYFRASSMILQEAVREGLTLYDIAILCCRNDNAGEIPSPLEAVVTTAANVESLAEQKGRWYLKAASYALAHRQSTTTEENQEMFAQSHTDNLHKLSSISSIPPFSSVSTNDFLPSMQSLDSGDDSSETEDGIGSEDDTDEWIPTIYTSN